MAKDKLNKVNVPELFFTHFLSAQAAQAPTNSVITMLANTAPKKRGRGQTRVLEGITLGQWEELYALAVDARNSMSGADRETTLRAAICAKVLAERMEAAGVDNPQPYVPTRTRKPKAEVAAETTGESEQEDSTVAALNTASEEATDDAEEDTDVSSMIPDEPATAVTEDDMQEPDDDALATLVDGGDPEEAEDLTEDELADLHDYLNGNVAVGE